jgi:superfamily II DNA/RNA helicase
MAVDALRHQPPAPTDTGVPKEAAEGEIPEQNGTFQPNAGIRRYLKQTASIPVRLTTMTTNEVFHAAAAPADASQPGQAQSPVATETRPVATEVAKEADAAADPVVGIVGYPAELLESGATWEQLGVDAAVIETVKKLTPPWDHPTQVQSQTIPSLLRGEDYIVQAPAGTGKTGTFVIAALAVLERSAGRATREEKRVELRELTVPQLTTLCGQLRLGKTGAKEELEENLCGAICELPRVVIVTSGQELVDQLKRDVARLDPSIRVCRVKPEPNDMAEALSSMPNFAGFPVLAASIGKLAGLLNTQRAVLSNCTLFVADEADKLLNEHGSEFESIVKKLPPNCQRTFWSATIDDNTERKLKALTRDPRSAAVQRVDTRRMLTKNCANYKVSVASDDATAKYAVMDLISRFSGFQQMLVFANKREEADYISRRLGAQGWSVDSMHGKDDSREREKILKRFRNKEVTVLISTDILSRGLDCADLNCVVNWGMPRRSARALPSCARRHPVPFPLHVHKPRVGRTRSVDAMRARGSLGHSHAVL